MESTLHWLGFGLCHQLPERSFFGGGLQVPVCARDTGIYVGFVIGLLLLYALDRGRRSSEMPPLFVSAMLVLFIGLMAADGVSSYAGWRTTTNDLRLLTGLFTGFGLAGFTAPLLNSQVWVRPGRGRVLGRPVEALLYAAGVPISFIVVRWGAPLLGQLYPVLVAGTIVATFSAVNLVLICLAPWFERRATLLVHLWLPISISVALTALELAASTWLKLWLLAVVSRAA